MLDSETRLCKKWAEQQEGVTRVYFFGSRVWGEPHSNSDLDILVVADPALAILEGKAWENELTNLLGVRVHLNKHCLVDPELMSKVKMEGQPVFSRYNSDCDFELDDLDEIDITEC